MPEIDFQSALETNWLKLGTLEVEAAGDRVIVVQDDFRYGNECTACGAHNIRMISQTQQASVVECVECKGTGMHRTNLGTRIIDKKCSACEGRGWHPCEKCKGTGTEVGGIAHPQDREQRPTTGTIVSVGWAVKHYKRGEGVIYPSFAGHFWELNAVDLNGREVSVAIGVLREDEIIARVKGHLELRRMKRSTARDTAA